MTVLLGKLYRGLHRRVVDGLEDFGVDGLSFRILEGNAKLHEAVYKALDADTNGSVSHVRVLGLGNWVVVSIDNTVEVLGNPGDDRVELVVIECLGLVVRKGAQRDGSEVANSNLIWVSVFNDLCAKIRTFDGSQILLVRFPIAGIFVDDVWGSCLDLGINNLVPKSHSFDGLATFALSFVLLVEILELFAPAVG